MENSIVKTGMKIDLHIHSIASATKDGEKVQNNTLENIPLLITRLDEQGVNICAITDHDTFSYDMYSALKAAEAEDNSIQRVLPGVEFSVRFKGDDTREKVVHVIAIFCDNDNQKVQNIESILTDLKPDPAGSYTEENFLKVLRTIDIDTILIAHQKNSLSSTKPRKNDASSLGENKFLEFIYSDFFEAFEFKNRRNEVFNKGYLLAKHLEGSATFITGTDCHDWSVYPKEDKSDSTIVFPYTYAKCLPTFKGLVMAVTGFSRLSLDNSFFNIDKYTLDSIELTRGGEKISIPLSRGINVIIGDNSIGKSLLLHAILGYQKDGEQLPAKIKAGYKSYLVRHNLQIKKQLSSQNIFCFDMQGEVRKRFEEGTLDATEFLSRYFPADIDAKPYRSVIENEIDRLITYLRKKFQLDSEIRRLNTFDFLIDSDTAESLTFLKNLRSCKEKPEQLEKIITALTQIETDLKCLENLGLDKDDVEFFIVLSAKLKELKQKYQQRITEIESDNNRIEIIAKTIDRVAKEHSHSIGDRQKRITAFWDHTNTLKTSIIEIIKKRIDLPEYSVHLDPIEIAPNCNTVHEYEFISRLTAKRIDSDFLLHHISNVIKSKKNINWKTITEKGLKDALLHYDGKTPVLDFFKAALQESIKEDFTIERTIICQGMDKSTEMSAGLDARVYFDLLSYEISRDGIYIIDQPEDNVSQLAIKNYMLEYFKTMGENRQVIIVTHNPQFIVNLDVDNLIFISRRGDEIIVQSGALEYECPDYSVLDIVADNIDGGLESIQKRWKRYAKSNRI